MWEDLNQFALKVDIKVQWSDMDATHQVNSTQFFTWFETARVEYFIRLGLDMIDNDDEPGFRVKQQNITYQTPVSYPDTIVIGIRTLFVDENKMEMEAVFYSRRHHTLIAKGSAIMEAFQFQTNTTLQIPLNIQRRISQLDEIPMEETPNKIDFNLSTSIPDFSDEEIAKEWMGEISNS